MKRRSFLTQMGYAVPASIALSSLLNSCKKSSSDDDGISSENRFKDYNIIVVGAGAAGLYSGWFLKERGFDVTILEASNRIGGRIKSHQGFVDYPLELGAERIYGGNTPWFEIVNESSGTFNEAIPEDYYFFRQDQNDPMEDSLKNKSVATQFGDFEKAMNFIQTAGSYNGADLNLEAAFTSNGGPWSMTGVLNGLIGNRQGTSNSRLGMKGFSQEFAARTFDDQTFTLKESSLLSVIEEKFSSVMNRVQFNKQVKTVGYHGEQVELTTEDGQKYSADRVIFAVPLTVLKNGIIDFNPGLPATKLDALNKMDMKGGMKVHMEFSTPFWNDLVTPNLGSIYGHNFLPEIYISNHGRSEVPVITALVMGERADQFSSMGDTTVNVILSYLGEIFGSQVPAQSFVQGRSNIMDWSKEPFINGAYSYSLVGGGNVFRKELAEPLENKLFFAGEATNFEGHGGTVHGAIESGIRVAQEIEVTIP